MLRSTAYYGERALLYTVACDTKVESLIQYHFYIQIFSSLS